MRDPFDIDLEDPDLVGEIGLLTGLIITARLFDHHLSVSEVDIALGLVSVERAEIRCEASEVPQGDASTRPTAGKRGTGPVRSS